MNLDALVMKGRLPWSPVMGGVETEMTVWAYTCLEPSEAAELAEVSFDSVTELQKFVQDKLTGRQLVFALADDLLISSWAVSEEKGELYEVATTFLDHVLQQARGTLNAGTRFRAKLAQVDVATPDLVEA
jgi:hypothetical protein